MRLIGATIVLVLIATLSGCGDVQTPGEMFRGVPAKKIFSDGAKDLAKGSYQSAVRHFEGLDANYPFSKFSQQARLDIIYAYYKTDDYVSTEAAADRYIRLYPQANNVDYAYYMKGLALYVENQGFVEQYVDWDQAARDPGAARKAFFAFEQLVRLFPNSVYAPDARAHMLALRDILAMHEVEVAKFYYVRHAYVAAANRALDVLKHYSRTPIVEKALVIMAKSYKKLGLDGEREQALKLLALNYPHNAYLKKAKK